MELAQRAGLGRNTISRWERSCFSPQNREIVLTVAEALCLYPNDLIATNELLQSAGFAPKPSEAELGLHLHVPNPSTPVQYMNQFQRFAVDHPAWLQEMPLLNLDRGGYPNGSTPLQKSLLNASKVAQQMTVKILSHLGDCFVEAGQYGEATNYYCLNALGNIYQKLGDLETAIDHYEQAITIACDKSTQKDKEMNFFSFVER